MNNKVKIKTARHIAVIVAGGRGLRMQSSQKKQYMELDGIPVLVHTLTAFDSHPRIDEVILVVPEADLQFCRDTFVTPYDWAKPLSLIPGGVTRQDSVSNGLARVKQISSCPEKTFVLVHDGVRPFVSPSLVDDCLGKAKEAGACIPGLQISDTVKKVEADGRIVKTLDRNMLFRAQTPQVFRLDLILSAFSIARETGFSGTDEASILENAKIPVSMVTGDRFNIKLTTKEDLVMARFLISQKRLK